MTVERIALPQVDTAREHEAAVYQAAEQLTAAFTALYDQRDYFDIDE